MTRLIIAVLSAAVALVALPPVVTLAFSYSAEDVAAISAVGCPTWVAAHNRAVATGSGGSFAPPDCAGLPPPSAAPPMRVPVPQPPPSGRAVQVVDPSSTIGQAATLICRWWTTACQLLQLPQTWVVYFTPSDAQEKGFVARSDPYTVHVSDEYAASPIATAMVMAHELTHVAQYTDDQPMPDCFDAELAAFKNEDAFMQFEGYHLAATTVWTEAEFDCANG